MVRVYKTYHNYYEMHGVAMMHSNTPISKQLYCSTRKYLPFLHEDIDVVAQVDDESFVLQMTRGNAVLNSIEKFRSHDSERLEWVIARSCLCIRGIWGGFVVVCLLTR